MAQGSGHVVEDSAYAQVSPSMALYKPSWHQDQPLHILARETGLSAGFAATSGIPSTLSRLFEEQTPEKREELRNKAKLAREAAKLKLSPLDAAIVEVSSETVEGPLGMTTRSGEPFRFGLQRCAMP